MVLKVPSESLGAKETFAGSAWVPRPFVGRLFIMMSAVTTGREANLRATEELSKALLQKGIPSRPHVPVIHGTGYDNGQKQEYALFLNYHAKGEHIVENEPAGTWERPDIFA